MRSSAGRAWAASDAARALLADVIARAVPLALDADALNLVAVDAALAHGAGRRAPRRRC